MFKNLTKEELMEEFSDEEKFEFSYIFGTHPSEDGYEYDFSKTFTKEELVDLIIENDIKDHDELFDFLKDYCEEDAHEHYRMELE